MAVEEPHDLRYEIGYFLGFLVDKLEDNFVEVGDGSLVNGFRLLKEFEHSFKNIAFERFQLVELYRAVNLFEQIVFFVFTQLRETAVHNNTILKIFVGNVRGIGIVFNLIGFILFIRTLDFAL